MCAAIKKGSFMKHAIGILVGITCLGLLLTPNPVLAAEPAKTYEVPSSRWIEADRTRALQALQGHTYDVLVVPFQVRGHALDSASRSLMTLSLAHGIQRSTSLTVADPMLVARALGPTARQYDSAAIVALAKQLGVQTIVVGWSGHDRQGQFSLRVERTDIMADGRLGPAIRLMDETQIPFDDVRIPYDSFIWKRERLVSGIAGPSQPPERVTISGADVPLPSSVDDGAEDSVIRAAHYLQLLSVLHPEDVSLRSREWLFARSLVLLEGVKPKSADYPLLKARALLYLNRRPAALAALRNGPRAEEQALLAYANGDLPGVRANASRIGSPVPAWIASVEAERLGLAYGGTPSPRLALTTFKLPGLWAAFVYQASVDRHEWRPLTARPVKLALDSAFPNESLSLEVYSAGKAARRESIDEYEVAQLVMRHVATVLDAGNPSPSGRLRLEPTRTDYAHLARAMLVDNVRDRMRALVRKVVQPASAVALAEQYEPLLADHPALSLAFSNALLARSEETAEPERANLIARGYETGRNGYLWTGGLTASSNPVLQQTTQFLPRLEGLPDDEKAMRNFASDWPRPGLLDLWIIGSDASEEMLRHCLAYTVSEFSCLTNYHAELAHAPGGKPAASKLLADNRDRFVGHPDRSRFLARHDTEADGPDGEKQALLALVESGTTDWYPYWKVATELAWESRHEEALEVIERYPGFHESGVGDPVALSNRAYDIGSLFFWAGEIEAATPLYERAVAYGTGSEGEIASLVRLALIRGDFNEARELALFRARRYGSKYAIRDLVGFFGMAGEPEYAWAVLNSVPDRFVEPELWVAALMAHRAARTPMDEVDDWAFADGRAGLQTERNQLLSLRFILMAHTVDRIPDESLVDVLKARDPRPKPRLQWYGGLTMEGDRPISHWLKRPSDLGVRPADTGMPRGASRVYEQPTTMIAKALVALAGDDFDTAYAILDEASDHYALGGYFPYYAWLSAKAGDTARVEAFIEKEWGKREKSRQMAVRSDGAFFDLYLSRAFMRGARAKHEEAIALLRRANNDVLHTKTRFLPTRYQILETARLLYADTGHDGYRTFALELARRNAIIEPMQAYTHSFVAMLSDDRRERIDALARAIALDPETRSAKLADAGELSVARQKSGAAFPMTATDSLASR